MEAFFFETAICLHGSGDCGAARKIPLSTMPWRFSVTLSDGTRVIHFFECVVIDVISNIENGFLA